MCNLKMYLHCFWSGSGMACKQYCPNSLWILPYGLGSLVQTYGCTRNPYLNSTKETWKRDQRASAQSNQHTFYLLSFPVPPAIASDTRPQGMVRVIALDICSAAPFPSSLQPSCRAGASKAKKLSLAFLEGWCFGDAFSSRRSSTQLLLPCGQLMGMSMWLMKPCGPQQSLVVYYFSFNWLETAVLRY